MQLLCGRVLRDPEWLPPAIRNLGICMELGADLTRHWWDTGVPTGDGHAQVVEAGAWPADLHPRIADLLPFEGASARQTCEFVMGPAEALPPFRVPRVEGQADWEASAFVDGAMSQTAKWAPWSRMAAFCGLGPGKRARHLPSVP